LFVAVLNQRLFKGSPEEVTFLGLILMLVATKLIIFRGSSLQDKHFYNLNFLYAAPLGRNRLRPSVIAISLLYELVIFKTRLLDPIFLPSHHRHDSSDIMTEEVQFILVS
jgi:hypothetical protein